jgi:hypothetical protein
MGYTTPKTWAYKEVLSSSDLNVYVKNNIGYLKGVQETRITEGIFKQALINGNFDVWQRGTSIAMTAADAYAADRWYAETATAGTDKTVSQQDGTGVAGSVLCARVAMVQDVDELLTFSQALETQDSKKFRGQKLTLSFWARGGAEFVADNPTLVCKIKTGKGTDQKVLAFTTSADAISENKTLTTSWVKHTITTTAVIASDITQIGISFAFTHAGAGTTTNYFEITQVQLCAGDVALPFQAKSFEEELQKCKRFYEKSFNYETTPAHGASATATAEDDTAIRCMTGNWFGAFVQFQVEKRIEPVVTDWGNNSGYWIYWQDQNTKSGQSTAGVAGSAGGKKGVCAQQQFVAGIVNIFGHYTADAEF